MGKPGLMGRKHSLFLQETIALSRAVALDMGYQYIDNLIFTLAAVRHGANGVAVALRENAIDLAVLEKLLKHGPAYSSTASLPLTKDFENAMKEAARFAELYQSEFIEVEHVVCASMQKYDFGSLLLLHAGFDPLVLEQSLLKHGSVHHAVLLVVEPTLWEIVKGWMKRKKA
jgi:ATP-dependent Clp protease ATP-binding subunit ClpA